MRSGQVRLWLSTGIAALGVATALMSGAGVALGDDGGTDTSSNATKSTSASLGRKTEAVSGADATTSRKEVSGADTSSKTTKSRSARSGHGSKAGSGADATTSHQQVRGADTNPVNVPGSSSSSATHDATDPSTGSTPNPVDQEDISQQVTAADPGTGPAAGNPTGSTGGNTAPGAGDSSTTPTAIPSPTPPILAEPGDSEPQAIGAATDTSSPQAATRAKNHHSAALSTAAPGAGASALAVAPTVTEVVAPAAPHPFTQGLQEFAQNVTLTVQNQIADVRNNLATLSADLARIFGFHQVVVTEPAPYGTPSTTTPYWVQSPNFASAALATVAIAYAQLLGAATNLQSFINQARVTDSLYYNDQKVLDQNGKTVLWADSYELLQSRGVRIMTRYYTADQQSQALNDLAVGLQNPTKAMIVALKGPVDGFTNATEKTVVVLGINTESGTVIVNDPTQADGQGFTISLADFLKQWGSLNYTLVTTQLNTTTPGVVVAPGKTKWVWSLPTAKEFRQNVAQAVVNQIDGWQGNFADLGADLARVFGIAPPITTSPEPADVEYGDFVRNKPFFIYQGALDTCAVMAAGGVIGQLTGTLPTEQEMLALARSLPSQVYPGQTVLEGTGNGAGDKHYGVNRVDTPQLLTPYGIDADVTVFTKGQGQLALQTLTAALADGQGAIVSVNNQVIYDAYRSVYYGSFTSFPMGLRNVRSNHSVIVLSVDVSKGIVYLNDSALANGQGLPIALDKFVDAWQTGAFTLTTAQLAAVSALTTTAQAA